VHLLGFLGKHLVGGAVKSRSNPRHESAFGLRSAWNSAYKNFLSPIMRMDVQPIFAD
jgi:hypothetical protein